MKLLTAATLCLLYTSVSGSVLSRTHDCASGDVITGCYITEDHQCNCDSGCPPVIFPYRDEDSCRRALGAQNQDDMCRTRPCKNNGYCTQSQKEEGFKCFCHGTGHYGKNCELPCYRPARGNLLRDPQFPSECITMG